VQHEVRVFADPDALAHAAAAYVAEQARNAVARRGRFSFAVSGGRTPWAMFAELASCSVPWAQTVIYQVDERIAPRGDPDRNLTNLETSLAHVPANIVAMPVEVDDLEAGASAYAEQLPERFDLVHLGLGPDGHTASLIPGDPVLAVADQLVAVTQPYQRRQRMTLTYPALARADQILWLIAGAQERDPLALLLHGNASIPAGRVTALQSLVMTDTAAM